MTNMMGISKREREKGEKKQQQTTAVADGEAEDVQHYNIGYLRGRRDSKLDGSEPGMNGRVLVEYITGYACKGGTTSKELEETLNIATDLPPQLEFRCTHIQNQTDL